MQIFRWRQWFLLTWCISTLIFHVNANRWPAMTHFLNTPAARSLSLAQVLRLSDEEAFAVFRRVRFAANGGEPFCPNCGCVKIYTLAETPVRWKCSACRKK